MIENVSKVLDDFHKNPNLGVALYTEKDGIVNGFFVAFIEFAEYRGGDAYYIITSIGETDEIEKRNNEWVWDVYFKE